MIELLAVAEHPGPPTPEGVREIPVGGLAALCTPAGPDEEPELTEDALWRREELVEELMRGRDLLPVRYGTRLADEDEALRAVAGRARELRAGLDRVRGAVELSLRLRARGALEPGEGPSNPPAAIGARLDELARESVVLRAGVGELLRAAYLVDRGRVDAFVDAVAALQSEHDGLALLLTGPWPPYSFSGPKAE